MSWLQRVRLRWRPWRALDPLERLGWIVFGAYCAVMVVSWIVFEMVDFRHLPRWVSVDQVATAVVATLVFRGVALLATVSLLWVGRWRYIRRLRAARFQLCPWCLYNLAGIGRTQSCPECGRAIERGRATRVWRIRIPNRLRRRRDVR